MEMGTLNSSILVIFLTMLWQSVQHAELHQFIARQFKRRARRLVAVVDPYLSVTVEEYEGGRLKSNDVFNEVKSYLATASTRDVRHLRAECASDADKVVLSMARGEEVADAFQGAMVWWSADSVPPPRDALPWNRTARAERRHFRLDFHESHRDVVLNLYLPHVRRQGRAVMVQNRQRRLYTNVPTEDWNDGYTVKAWTHVPFVHPKTFNTLAMDAAKKKDIIDDLDMFKSGKDYYKRVGKPWKRGYLLYGPPGTGKSSMVAAMATYLDYDVYDFELTSVKTNTELRKLLIETQSKSIMVFEDIDCSLDLTGKRKSKEEEEQEESDADALRRRSKAEDKDNTKSKVTLSGLLNIIDGLWSACAEERLVVFTTNHIESLDLALIRTGRMDKKIEMSYCDFGSFEFLAKMHLGVGSHDLFPTVGELLREVNMAAVDVAEHLARKSPDDDDDSCLARLVKALHDAREDGVVVANGDQQPH